MNIATVRVDAGTRAARVTDGVAELLDVPDVGALLRSSEDWRSSVDRRVVSTVPLAQVSFAPLVSAPSKILCVGLNYRQHAEEMGIDLPTYPTLFAKFAQSLVGAHDPVEIPYNSQSTDWEVELVLVAQGYTRHATDVQAENAIAGFTVGNDVSERTYQRRTTEWLQGKSFDRTTPVGPVLVTADETGVNPDLPLRCLVDGVTKQSSRTSDMIFKPAEVVAYVSSIMTLEPGDLIFLGTPSGVGSGREPAEHLSVGTLLTSEIDGVGRLDNLCIEGRRPVHSSDKSVILTTSS